VECCRVRKVTEFEGVRDRKVINYGGKGENGEGIVRRERE